MCYSVDLMALGKTRGVNIDLRKKRGRSSAGSNSPLGGRSSRFRENLIAGLFWNLMSSCKTAGWKRRPGRERGAMLVGGASRGGGGGEADETGGREGKAEVKKTGTQTFAAGSEENRSKTHRQTHTHVHVQLRRAWSGSLRSPAAIFTAPWWAGLQRASTGPSRIAASGAQSPLLLPARVPSPRCSGPCRQSRIAQKHRRSRRGRGLKYRWDWSGDQRELLQRRRGAPNEGGAPGYPRS